MMLSIKVLKLKLWSEEVLKSVWPKIIFCWTRLSFLSHILPHFCTKLYFKWHVLLINSSFYFTWWLTGLKWTMKFIRANSCREGIIGSYRTPSVGEFDLLASDDWVWNIQSETGKVRVSQTKRNAAVQTTCRCHINAVLFILKLEIIFEAKRDLSGGMRTGAESGNEWEINRGKDCHLFEKNTGLSSFPPWIFCSFTPIFGILTVKRDVIQRNISRLRFCVGAMNFWFAMGHWKKSRLQKIDLAAPSAKEIYIFISTGIKDRTMVQKKYRGNTRRTVSNSQVSVCSRFTLRKRFKTSFWTRVRHEMKGLGTLGMLAFGAGRERIAEAVASALDACEEHLSIWMKEGIIRERWAMGRRKQDNAVSLQIRSLYTYHGCKRRLLVSRTSNNSPLTASTSNKYRLNLETKKTSERCKSHEARTIAIIGPWHWSKSSIISAGKVKRVDWMSEGRMQTDKSETKGPRFFYKNKKFHLKTSFFQLK